MKKLLKRQKLYVGYHYTDDFLPCTYPLELPMGPKYLPVEL